MKEYELILKDKLTAGRYDHVCAVRDCAGKLADLHGIDPERARLAGLLHDYARDLPAEDLLHIGRMRNLIKHQLEERVPVLLHGPVGAALIKDQLGVDDQQVLEAVAMHTLAAPAMGSLAELIYVADLIAEGRDFPSVDRLRKIAREDLDQALLECIASAICYCLERRQLIHPQTIEAWNFYSSEGIERRALKD